MSTFQAKVTVILSEIRSYAVPVNESEYLEWLEGEDPSDEHLKEFVTGISEWEEQLEEDREIRSEREFWGTDIYGAEVLS